MKQNHCTSRSERMTRSPRMRRAMLLLWTITMPQCPRVRMYDTLENRNGQSCEIRSQHSIIRILSRWFGKWMLQRYISLRRVALDQLTQFVEGSCHGSFHPLQNDFLVLNVVQAEVRLRKGPRAPKGSVYYSLDNRQLT